MAFMTQVCRVSRNSFSERSMLKSVICYHFIPSHSVVNINKENVTCKRNFIYSPEKFNGRYFSSDKDSKESSQSTLDKPAAEKLSQRARLKQAIRDYGATIIIFHVTISLASLGICYLAISNGINVTNLLTYVGFSESITSSKVAQEGSTFAISYAVHKLFAPIRIGITLSSAPFIVRYLRKINVIKPPKTS